MLNLLVVDRGLMGEEQGHGVSRIAAEQIQTPGNPIDVVVLGDGIQKPSPISLIRLIHERRPGTPIYFLEGETTKALMQEQSPLGIQAALPRPRDLNSLATMIQSRISIRPADLPKPSPESEEFTLEGDEQYIRVLARNFLWSNHTVFDVFVRLKSGRMIKILNREDGFDESRLISYMNRGVHHFYIRAEDQVRLIQSCETVAKRMKQDFEAPLLVRSAPVMQMGELALDFFKRQGTPPSAIQSAFEFTQHLGTLMKRPEWRKDLPLKMFLEDLRHYQHGMAVALVAALLIKEMGLQSPRLMNVVGIAALFHDIGLQGIFPEDVEHQEIGTLSSSDQRLLESHPLLGAKALARGPGVDPVSLTLVEQHHERRSRTGYPHRLDGSHILALSQVVGVADEIVNAILLQNQVKGFDFRTHLEATVFDGFSFSVIEVVKKMLKITRSTTTPLPSPRK